MVYHSADLSMIPFERGYDTLLLYMSLPAAVGTNGFQLL